MPLRLHVILYRRDMHAGCRRRGRRTFAGHHQGAWACRRAEQSADEIGAGCESWVQPERRNICLATTRG